ncbi:hydrogenase expression/formation protein HypE [Thermodesulfobacteriota bacterium]
MKYNKILLDHGSGGKISHNLISEMILPLFENPVLSHLDDGAVLDINGIKLAFSTDSYTVDPIFFPGGNIGDLAVNGTVNDIAMCGAEPLFLSSGLIIEEGFSMSDLNKILESMHASALDAGVIIVTGDTKVVPKGSVDGIFINTSGIGLIPEGVDVSGRNAKPGDKIILSGSVGDHGIAILLKRKGMNFDCPVSSDTAALNHMVNSMLESSRGIHALRDPTRGGVGTALNEIAMSSGVGIIINEESIFVRDEVAGICELMGFDPLYLANEGKLLAFVSPEEVEKTFEVMRGDTNGREAGVIGEVVSENPGMVVMKTRIGGKRIIDTLTAEQLPRIC